MSQCTIYRLRGSDDLVFRVQSDLGTDTPLILCAPVVPLNQLLVATPKLHLSLTIEGEERVILLSQMAAIPKSVLGEVVTSAPQLRDDVVAGVDLLVSGF